ncbi:MAG: sigma-54 dependent transcriptional regulator [bacterium]
MYLDIKVLIADDNVDFSSTLAEIVSSFGYKTLVANTPKEALAFLSANPKTIGAALLDIEFGPRAEMDGLDILERIRYSYPEIPVVMISGKGTIESAVRATKLGAINFVEKSSISNPKIKALLDIAMERLGPQGEADDIRKFLESFGIIAKSKIMIEIGDSMIRYARTDLNVLITGDTGTGKKLVAKAIHNASKRARFPFITVDIPNIPKELLQSELFGHVKGAFSGATETKKGLFNQAHHGTVFLDEIGEMSLELQSSLFIPIEDKCVRKVGSVKSEDIDIRFVSATDRDLLKLMREGVFREQLYHRLRECEIRMPNLTERKEDIPLIIEHYVKKHNEDFQDQKYFSPSALDLLNEGSWHGNVRELSSIIKVAMQTSLKEQVEAMDIQRIIKNSPSIYRSLPDASMISSHRTLKEDLAKVDKQKIESTLSDCKGNVTKAANKLGVSRETLHNKIRRYEIEVVSFRKKASAP